MADPLKDVLYQRMFSVFSYFADATSSDGLHPSQASFILDEMLRESGRPSTSQGSTFGHDSVTFRVSYYSDVLVEVAAGVFYSIDVNNGDQDGVLSVQELAMSPSLTLLWTDQIKRTDLATAHSDIRLAIERPTRSALQDLDHKRSLRHGRRYDREASERQQLETEKRRLEFQLEQERLALKDEEIVRGLATRMLEEEKQKNERMERVLLELQSKLGQRLDTVLEAGTLEAIQDDERPDDEQSSEGHSVEIEISENGCGDVELPNGINGVDVDDEVWRKDDYLIVSTQSI
ncbi:unnamed protein product [Angiostrongylus costaricensis]|uniref:CACTA en-spm transposon protein n=1 Tax=Angiostrongylus costaricensis TaxID=334426 RepID=A0A0R3PXD8_ANGCS|nr:unnamed protein product [Angiostrongylus costaricensis]